MGGIHLPGMRLRRLAGRRRLSSWWATVAACWWAACVFLVGGCGGLLVGGMRLPGRRFTVVV